MRKQSEANLQAECVSWLNNNYCLRTHSQRSMIFLVPNEVASLVGASMKFMGVPERYISKVVSIVTQKMRNTGLLEGVSDNVVLGPNGQTYFVEFKLPGNRQQQNQVDFQKRVESLGHTYIVIKSMEQFISFFTYEFKLDYDKATGKQF